MPTTSETRRSLHAVAELLVAGPQYDASGTIRLRVVPGGFATVASPDVQVVGGELLVADRAHTLDGRTIRDLAAATGLTPRPLGDVQKDVTDLGTEAPLAVSDAGAAEVMEAFRIGDEAIARFAPELDRVLWPEHFDLGIAVDEVNYGVSAGDHFIDAPYAYVGPWNRDGLDDEFWNAPFGASALLSELGDPAGVAEFFQRGRALT